MSNNTIYTNIKNYIDNNIKKNTNIEKESDIFNNKFINIYIDKKIRNNKIYSINKIIYLFLRNNIIKKKKTFKNINKYLFVIKIIFIVLLKNKNSFRKVSFLLNRFLVKYIYELFIFISKSLYLKKFKKFKYTFLKKLFNQYYIPPGNLLIYILTKRYLIYIYHIIYEHISILLNHNYNFSKKKDFSLCIKNSHHFDKNKNNNIHKKKFDYFHNKKKLLWKILHIYTKKKCVCNIHKNKIKIKLQLKKKIQDLFPNEFRKDYNNFLNFIYVYKYNPFDYLKKIHKEKRRITYKNLNFSVLKKNKIQVHITGTFFKKNFFFKNNNNYKKIYIKCKTFFYSILPFIDNKKKNFIIHNEYKIINNYLLNKFEYFMLKKNYLSFCFIIYFYILKNINNTINYNVDIINIWNIIKKNNALIFPCDKLNNFSLLSVNIFLYAKRHRLLYLLRKCNYKKRIFSNKKKKILFKVGNNGIITKNINHKIFLYNFKKNVLCKYNIKSIFKKYCYIKKKVENFFKRENNIKYNYDKKLKNHFINFIFRKCNYISFIFNYNDNHYMCQNKFIINNMMLHTKKNINLWISKEKKKKLSFFFLNNRKKFREIKVQTYKDENGNNKYNYIIDLIIKLVKKKRFIMNFCCKIKDIVYNIRNKNFQEITKYLLILKNFINNYQKLFFEVLKFLKFFKLSSFKKLNNKSFYHNDDFFNEKIMNIYTKRNKINMKFSPHFFKKKKNKIFIEICLLFIYLVVNVIKSYLYLLYSSLMKYKENVKKNYILFKIIILNKYGILFMKRKIYHSSNIKKIKLTNTLYNKNIFYRSNLFLCIYRILNSINIVNFSFIFFCYTKKIKSLKVILINFLLIFLRLMTKYFSNYDFCSKGNCILNKKKKKEYIKKSIYKLKTKNIILLIENQIVSILLKKRIFFYFETFFILNSKKKRTRFISLKSSMFIINSIIKNNKKKYMLLYKYYSIYLEFLILAKKLKIFKKKNIFFKNNFPLLDDLWFHRIIHFQQRHFHQNDFYLNMVNKYFLLFVITCYLRKSKKILKFQKIFLKILILLSLQKNFTLEYYFYKIKILEFMLHFTNYMMDRKKKNYANLKLNSNCNISNRHNNLHIRKFEIKEKNNKILETCNSRSDIGRNIKYNNSKRKKIYIPPLLLKNICDSSGCFIKKSSNVSSLYSRKSGSSFIFENFNNSTKCCNSNFFDFGKRKLFLTRNNYYEENCFKNKENCKSIERKNKFRHDRKKEYNIFLKKIRVIPSINCFNIQKKSKKRKITEECHIISYVILLIFSLIISYNKKDINDFYFNENYYDEYKSKNKKIEKKIIKRNQKINTLLENYLKILNNYFSFHKLNNSEDLNIMRIVQSYLNHKKNNKLINRIKKYVTNNTQLNILYNLSVSKSHKSLKFFKKIKDGSYGNIYMCYYSIFQNNPFIIKLINIEKYVNENYMFKNIYNEVKFLLKFQFKNMNICQIYEYGIIRNDNDFSYYILMKYYDNNLREFMNVLHNNYLKKKEAIKTKSLLFSSKRTLLLQLKKKKILKKLLKKKKTYYFKGNIYNKNVRSFYYQLLIKISYIKLNDFQYIIFILSIFNQILEQIINIHKRGIIHFDINTYNILMNYKKKVPLLFYNNNYINDFPHRKKCNNIKILCFHKKLFSLVKTKKKYIFKELILKRNKWLNKNFKILYVPSVVINDFGESKSFYNNKNFLFFRKNRGNEILASPELMINNVKNVNKKRSNSSIIPNYKNYKKIAYRNNALSICKNKTYKKRKKYVFLNNLSIFSFYKYVSKIRIMIIKRLKKKYKFQKRKEKIFKSDVWLLGMLLFEIITNKNLMNVHNFLYIKIYEKKDILDRIIDKTFNNQFKKIRELLNFFFQFELKKRKNLRFIYKQSKILYNFYMIKLIAESKMLKKLKKYSNNIICKYSKIKRKSLYDMKSEDVYLINNSFTHNEKNNMTLYIKKRKKRFEHCYSIKKMFKYFISYIQKKIYSFNKYNFNSYSVDQNSFNNLSIKLFNLNNSSNIFFSIKKVNKILNFLVKHNIVRVYNFYFILKIDEKIKEFLFINNFNKHAIFYFPSIFHDLDLFYHLSDSIINVQTLYFKKRLFYKKNKNTKKILLRYLKFPIKKNKLIFNNFYKISKIRIYKNYLKNLSYFFLFFFINVQLKLNMNSNYEKKKYVFILNNQQNKNCSFLKNPFPYNFSNIFLLFFFCVLFKINLIELFFFFKGHTAISFSDMDISVLQTIINNFF
ncbi:protein kinase, putative [Plasmodium gallinaceum]|uniref:Protein kinase, putative n=1 Tax=Plasmodium gallinaceum TaxID=5849 RepID=A0A1J1GTM8_PLAGA|nr:protein kinase, putative [Plasmodium gallinaceum]CRG95842.1 protein kinase, putative [Plasmodium gallinaceum]